MQSLSILIQYFLKNSLNDIWYTAWSNILTLKMLFFQVPLQKHTVILIDLPNLNLHGIFLMPDYLSFGMVVREYFKHFWREFQPWLIISEVFFDTSPPSAFFFGKAQTSLNWRGNILLLTSLVNVRYIIKLILFPV